jgi:serine/threonine protein kinase
MDHSNKYNKYKNKYILLKTYLEIQKGGEVLGKGAWGEVSDLCSDNSDLCHTLSNNSILTAYTKYDLNSDKFNTMILDKKNFDEWIKTYHKNKIVKKFISKTNFESELKEINKVANLYVNKKLITIDKPYISNHHILGIKIEQDNKIFYISFGIKCNPNYTIADKNIRQFIENILESIKIINKEKYYHNDIKLSNIIYCDSENRFNLIDWGASRSIDWNKSDSDEKLNKAIDECKIRGDPVFSSPMKLYIVYANNWTLNTTNIPSITLKYELHKGKKDWNYLKDRKLNKKIINLLKIQHNIFTEELNEIKKKVNDKHLSNTNAVKKTFEKYHDSFDVYMFGMTLYHIIIKYNIFSTDANKFNILSNYIEKLISLKTPLNINSAINEFDKIKEEI